jgi:hypothetical protein
MNMAAKRSSLLLALLLALQTTVAAPPENPQDSAAPDIARLIAALAQPTPATTAFHERRASPLLAEALGFSGELQRPAPGVLIKTVSQPYRESTRIADGRVTVEREGQPPRRFSLSRAPELLALTASFEAVLSGDLALLERHYRLRMEGSADSWQLRLLPRDARLARRLVGLSMRGAGAHLRCIDLDLVGDETSRMWLGEVAASARDSEDAGARDALCSLPAASTTAASPPS